ncbi:MAG: hypothetical protein M3Q07_26335 [Pseudobdellovibrionaceae bacterium]|nr:hypothetical protein [Pseudobdellovibrionaceae bacterium]
MKMAVGLVALAAASAAFANEVDLNNRKGLAAQRISDANSLVQNYGLQRVALDTYFHGPNGVNSLASQWLAESQKIVNASGALSGVQEITDPNAALQALKLVEKFYSDQGPLVAKLKDKSRVMKRNAERIKALNSSIAELPAPKTEELKALFTQLDDSRKRGLTATENIVTSVHGLEPKVLTLLSDARPLLVNRLKKTILENGWKELEAPLSAAADVMLFESEARPLIAELEAIDTRLTDATLNFAYYYATDSKSEADKACAAFDHKLAVIPLSEKSKRKGLDRKTALCGSAKVLWESLQQSGLTKVGMIKEYGALQKAQYRGICKGSSATVNCEKFATLAAIPSSTVDQMTEPQLRFYEEAWRGLGKSL